VNAMDTLHQAANGFTSQTDSRRTIHTRRPQLSGQFYASPRELRTYGRHLGLTLADRAVIEAIDDLPSNWDATYAQIGDAADVSEVTVKRSLKKLTDANLINRRDRYWNGRRCGSTYDLTPLWNRLAEIARADGAGGQIDPTTGQDDLWSTGQNDPPPSEVLPSEEESRSRSRGEDVVERASETTTTTADPVDVEDECETPLEVDMHYGYYTQMDRRTGREHRRKPGDWERAKELAACVDWERFRTILEFAVYEDPYSLGCWMKRFPTVETFEATERTWLKREIAERSA